MKRLILFAAVALAFSTGAIAQNGAVKSTATKLSDAQLDQVTAGGLLMFNPGKRVAPLDMSAPIGDWSCMNCAELKSMYDQFGPGGVKISVDEQGVPVLKFIGKWRNQ